MNFTRKLMNREAFMGLFIVGVGGLGSLILGIPIIGFVLSPLIKPPPSVWRDVGPVEKFKVGETVAVVYDYDQGVPQLWSGATVVRTRECWEGSRHPGFLMILQGRSSASTTASRFSNSPATKMDCLSTRSPACP